MNCWSIGWLPCTDNVSAYRITKFCMMCILLDAQAIYIAYGH